MTAPSPWKSLEKAIRKSKRPTPDELAAQLLAAADWHEQMATKLRERAASVYRKALRDTPRVPVPAEQTGVPTPGRVPGVKPAEAPRAT